MISCWPVAGEGISSQAMMHMTTTCDSARLKVSDLVGIAHSLEQYRAMVVALSVRVSSQSEDAMAT